VFCTLENSNEFWGYSLVVEYHKALSSNTPSVQIHTTHTHTHTHTRDSKGNLRTISWAINSFIFENVDRVEQFLDRQNYHISQK
jgi:hypothetical protein